MIPPIMQVAPTDRQTRLLFYDSISAFCNSADMRMWTGREHGWNARYGLKRLTTQPLSASMSLLCYYIDYSSRRAEHDDA